MRFLLRAFLGLVALIVLAGVGLFFFLPTDRIGQIAAERFEAATGRTLTLTEGFSPSLYPTLGVRTGPITISNPDWSDTPNMVTAEGAAVGVSLLPLLSGQIEVEELTLLNPVIALERDADGRANWQLTPTGSAAEDTLSDTAAEAEPSASSGPALTRVNAQIVDGVFSYRDAASGAAHLMDDVNARIGFSGPELPAEVSGELTWQGQEITLAATLGAIGALLNGEMTDIAARIEGDLGQIAVNGALALSQTGALHSGLVTVSAGMEDLAPIMTALALPPLPASAGALRDVSAEASVGLGESGLESTLTAQIIRDDVPVRLSGRVDGAADWLSALAFQVDMSVAVEGLADASYRGTVDVSDPATPAANGAVSFRSDDPRALIAWGAGTAPDLPDGVLTSVALDGTLKLAGVNRVDLTGLTLALDELTATGSLGVTMGGARPAIRGALATNRINLDPFLGGEGEEQPASGGGASTPGGPAGWSTDPLPLELLRLADADLDLDAEGLKAGTIDIGRTGISIDLTDGVLTARLREAAAFGGNMAAEVRANAGSKAVSLNANLASIRIEQVLLALAGLDRLLADGALTVEVAGDGSSLDSLMNSLDGQIGLNLADGAIQGVNIAQLAANFTNPGAAMEANDRTDFTSAVAAFTITDGVMDTRELSMLGPLLRLTGLGTVDLGGQSLQMRLAPRIVGDLQGQGGNLDASGIVLPVIVRGPWSDVSFAPDLEALPALQAAQDRLRQEAQAAEERLRREAAEAEQRLRDQAEERVNRELDALRNQLQEANPILRLFD
ncbi:uncharacterized protein involved in outer membrane biogenesis [Rubricella aquisinus]|uniref:Uncharacterized protein involved in outer membrane biogenesis n=1 Tax=Rubricella aquisinus TaxID=2028108 RepID=A0A840WRI4_9RHOB|nr:AsmA family protein [Rubricella aquisinus]MBB5516282.1 uncharacterized protein involved in outer membrane biogenesis [Rubricella aquisinus]